MCGAEGQGSGDEERTLDGLFSDTVMADIIGNRNGRGGVYGVQSLTGYSGALYMEPGQACP